MIVDLFTRVWDTPQQMSEAILSHLRRRRTAPWNDYDAGAEAHADAMKPVHNAVIHGLVSRRLGAEVLAERVAELVSSHPEKLLGFAGIDPLAGDPVAAMERAMTLGLVGVTVSPALQGFHPQHTRATMLYEACEARGVPIFFESGTGLARDAVMEYAQPVLLDEIARTHPRLKIVISGLGDPFIDQTLALMIKHPTVFGELSSIATRPWRLYNALIEAHQLGVMNQLLFGSGFPATRPDRAIVALYSASSTAQGTNLPGVPREQLRAVVERDAFACLGLVQPKPKQMIDKPQGPALPTAPTTAHSPAETQNTSPHHESSNHTQASPDPNTPDARRLEEARR